MWWHFFISCLEIRRESDFIKDNGQRRGQVERPRIFAVTSVAVYRRAGNVS